MNSRHDRIIRVTVAIGSLLAIIAIGIPWVDEYIRLRRESSELSELQTEMAVGRTRDQQLSKLETKIENELTALSNRCVDRTKADGVRDTLIGIVRDSGGRLRHIDIGNTESRPWAIEDDDPACPDDATIRRRV